MEQLRNILFSENSELRTTKNLNNMDIAVKNALNENSKEAIDILCDFFFSLEANTPLQTFCKHTQENIRKQNLTELFETEATKKLNESFWENTSLKQNFTALANALSLCGPDFVFKENENTLVTKFTIIFQSCNENSLSEDIYTSASKIIEMFVEYFSEPHPFTAATQNISDIFKPFIENSSTFSILSSSILNIIQFIPSFDTTFSFIRSLAILLCKFLPDQTINSLYSTSNPEGGENISITLTKYLNNYQQLLILSVIGRNLKNSDFCNYCFSMIKTISDSSNLGTLSVIDRIFLYNSMNQITPLVSSLNDFVYFYGESLLRDFDSSNNLITSALRSIFQTLIKYVSKSSEKAKNDQNTHNIPTEETVCEQLLTFISPLSYVSKLKTWLLPLLLKHVATKSIPNEQLIKMAQDPSAGNFVSKCVKCIKGSEDGWKILIEKCKETAVKKCHVCGDMIVLRPILEPIFDNNPESIEFAFKTFQLVEIPQNSSQSEVTIKNGFFSDEWIVTTWLMFECILSSPRSKWRLTNDQIRLLVASAVNCGNWDVRSGCFTVFTVGGFPQNDSDVDFIIGSFENLLFFDSPKHVSQVKATFADFLERINKRSKTLKEEQTRRIERELLKTACEHMMPSYISSHRQFAFDIARPIIDSNPALLAAIDEDNFWCLRSVLSLTLDSNSALSNASAALVRKISTEDEKTRNEVLKMGSFSSIIDPKNNTQAAPREEHEFESIQSILSEVQNVQNWEQQCALFEEMNVVISRGRVRQEEIVEASEKLFSILLHTRILGVTCRGQIALESIARRIVPPSKLESILDRWTNELMATLDHFDMENMRRSAALPYLALSILRLNTPDIMQTKHSIFERLVQRLVEVIKNSSSEDEKRSQEATHSLNMIRAVLTDKVTSPLSEVILPSVFESIFIVLEKIDNWDLVTAANLCLAAVIRKIKKKNVSQEDDNDTKSSKPFDTIETKKSLKTRKVKKNQQSLLLNQFFAKMPNSKESIISGLKSSSPHLNYLSLLTLSSFSGNSAGSPTDTQLQQLVLHHLLSSRDSRMRRLAARSAVTVTNENDLHSLFVQTVSSLSHKSFNSLHGQVMLLREILQHIELVQCDISPAFIQSGRGLPSFDWRKIPPFIHDDLFFVCKKVGRSELIPIGAVDFNDFYYDQVSLFLHRPLIQQPLSVSCIVALLLRVNASGRTNEIGFDHITSPNGSHNNEDFTIPADLADQIAANVFVKNAANVNDALLFAGLNFLIETPLSPEKLNTQLLVSLVKQRFHSHIAAALIHLLYTSSKGAANVNFSEIFDVLEDYALDLSEEMTPVHVSIAELLSAMYNGGCAAKADEIALRLLIDDVPKVRTMTMISVSKSFGLGLTCERLLFERVLARLLNEGRELVARLLLRWIRLIYARIETDTHGEALCVIVDEFFVVRKLAKALGIELRFDVHQAKGLLALRKEFAENALRLVTEKLEGKDEE